MNKRNSFLSVRWRVLLICLLPLSMPGQSLGLPDDAEQPLNIDSGAFEYLLEEGVVILTGTSEVPAKVTQGSRELTGLRIHLERDDETITKVTVTGSPARFQQISKPGEEPVKVSGQTLVYDNAGQLLTVEGDGFIEQAGMNARNCYFEYHLDSSSISAPDQCSEQARLVIPPSTSR